MDFGFFSNLALAFIGGAGVMYIICRNNIAHIGKEKELLERELEELKAKYDL